MDRVRFGRALGYGARHAAKTVAAAVEAASASPAESLRADRAPSPARGAGGHTSPVVERPPLRTGTSDRTGQPRERPAQVGGGLKHLKRTVWGPLAVFSGALWLRVTGLFFALIAFTVGAGAWRLREAWHGGLGTPPTTRFWSLVLVAGAFLYFAVSSFLKANRLEKRAAAGLR